jgi:hypothetical protein
VELELVTSSTIQLSRIVELALSPLVLNGYSYTLNKEAKFQYYWRCETRFCSATLITTRNLITGIHSMNAVGEIHHLHFPSIPKQEILVFTAKFKRRVREELTPIALLIEEEMRKVNLSSGAQQLLIHSQHMSKFVIRFFSILLVI